MNQEKIGKFIQEMRKEKNMTQGDLAEKMGVTDKSISRWENGKTMPDLSIINDLAQELDIEVSELLNGRKMTKEELIKMRDTINNVIEYSNSEKNKKTTKLNKYFMIGLGCTSLILVDRQFDIFTKIFKGDIPNFISGLLCGIAVLSELIGFYNNNHDQTLRQRKIKIFKK